MSSTILAFLFLIGVVNPTFNNLEQRFDKLSRLENQMLTLQWTTRQTAIAYKMAYTRDFEPYQNLHALRKLNDNELRLLFRAADMTSDYTHDRRLGADIKLDLAEMAKRRTIRSQDYIQAYYDFLDERLFKEATDVAVHQKSLKLTPFPRIVDKTTAKSGPTVFELADTMRFAVRQSVSMQGPSIIVTSEPFCHFCRNAAKAIEADPHLRMVFRKYATWIADPDGAAPLTQVRDWNRKYPKETMVLAYDRDDWPSIDDWATPTFYFFHGRHLVDKVVGWPRPGRKAEVESAIKKILQTGRR